MRHIYSDIVSKVAKPARYLGGEYLSTRKDHGDVDATIALAFPDVYEIGMSHLGTKILYSLLNASDSIACERAFCPWVDMEQELRAAELPLVSLETQTPLCDFDIVGFSLQFELTYSNVLTMLELGGIPLRAADRTDEHPIVLAGGPVATHPEPVSPFFDAFFIGEAEEELTDLVVKVGKMRKQGIPRQEILFELASEFPLYVPSGYDTEVDQDTQMVVVGEPIDERVPARVRRGMVENLDDYPFPTESPVPYAEAVFDRAAVEIARGCTEGCRFCQAGMIYRPVRERSPDAIVDAVIGGVERAGYDETALTCLSTADYSAITPLVRTVMGKLRKRKVSMSVSSLRAYGLDEEILDEMATMRITGLTFAPEAGTQRMRDVVNKNITEEHIATSTKRVFSRGWSRLKLYFMIGLPTEEDEDVLGVVDTGERMLELGRELIGKKAQVTVSASSHVPKPHTPFQWCAQDSIAEIKRKQALLRQQVRSRGLRLKYHDCGGSFVEGVFARGDRRLADALELAWREGARFDGWDEHFDLAAWQDVFARCKIDTDALLGTRPISARLPWDHIDVGLEDGFLLGEYRKAVKNRLSPPCGKVAGQLVHHTNLQDAEGESKRLVCYDCGVACDLSKMKSERLVFLGNLGAKQPRESQPPKAIPKRPQVSFEDKPQTSYRIRYAKLGRLSFLGHLDLARVLMRTLRRADYEVSYSRGFHPKPKFSFAPALSLGVPGLGELVDITLDEAIAADELLTRLREVCPEDLVIHDVIRLEPKAKSLSKLISSYDLLVAIDQSEDAGKMVTNFMSQQSLVLARGKKKSVDVRERVLSCEVLADPTAAVKLLRSLNWPEDKQFILVTVKADPDGSAKPVEVAKALGLQEGDPEHPLLIARLGFATGPLSGMPAVATPKAEPSPAEQPSMA